MVPVAGFLVVLARALWAGRFFDREGSSSKRARRRSPIRRAAFHRKLSVSTRRYSKCRVCPTQRCVRAVYRRGTEKVELFAFPVQANALARARAALSPVREVDERSRANWWFGVASVARERVISREAKVQ